MVKIRLTRTGRKNHAAYRVVAIDSRSARDSRAIEELGHFLPHQKDFKVNQERVEYWLSVGAQPSDTVARQLIKLGILPKDYMEQKTFSVAKGRKAQERAEAAEEAAKQAEEAKAAAKAEAEKPAEGVEETPAETTEEAAEAEESETKEE